MRETVISRRLYAIFRTPPHRVSPVIGAVFQPLERSHVRVLEGSVGAGVAWSLLPGDSAHLCTINDPVLSTLTSC